MNEFSELLKSIAACFGSVAWPIAAVIITVLFRKHIAEALGRLRKGKLFGQELELDQKLEEAASDADAAVAEAIQQPITTGQTNPAGDRDTNQSVVGAGQVAVSNNHMFGADQFANEVLQEASRSPKAALITLASGIETEVQRLVAAIGHADKRRYPVRRVMRDPELSHLFPPHLTISVESFWDVRNRVIHGKGTDDDAIRAIDIGLTVLQAIQAIPRSRIEVHHPGVPVLADKEGKIVRQGVKAVILRCSHPDEATTFRVYPTTLSNYKRGDVLSWEWKSKPSWEQSWYADPETGEIKEAWSSSMTFVGRPLNLL